jgi:hypothetical protein
MIFTRQYDGVVFEDLEDVFKKTNVEFYEYITSIGLSLDLSKKDQQKIYFNHFIIHLCDLLKAHNCKIVFFINTFSICKIQTSIIKKIKRIFGIRIWEYPCTMESFVEKLHIRSIDVTDIFEIWLNSENKPKSFRHIKKYLDKEGLTNLSDFHFQDITNKIAILC